MTRSSQRAKTPSVNTSPLPGIEGWSDFRGHLCAKSSHKICKSSKPQGETEIKTYLIALTYFPKQSVYCDLCQIISSII
jgi:hypothetical protein